jgi:hypothetical protein
VTGVRVFPLRGYSYGWICELFASICALLATLLVYLGISKILKAPKEVVYYQAAPPPPAMYSEPYPTFGQPFGYPTPEGY